MRIGLDVRFLAQPGSGVHRYLVQLLHWLPQVAPEHEYFLYGHASAPWPAPAASMHQRPIGGPRALYSFWPGLQLALRRDRLDLYHATAYTLPFAMPCASVLTLHDLSVAARPGWYPGWRGHWFGAYIRRSASRASRVAADSESTRGEVLHHFRLPPEKVTTIHLGGAGPEFAPRDRRAAREVVRQQTGLSGPFILYPGAAHTRKNLPRLIEAFGAARQSAAFSQRLLLIGPATTAQGATLDEIISRLGLSDHIGRLPLVAEALVPILYAAADAVIYPSLYEGFGLPVLEAMASGTPVITSNSTSLAEVAGEAGVLIDPEDVPAMAAAIARVLTDPALREDLAARGLEQARRFSWETCARQTVQLCQAAHADSRHGRIG